MTKSQCVDSAGHTRQQLQTNETRSVYTSGSKMHSLGGGTSHTPGAGSSGRGAGGSAWARVGLQLPKETGSGKIRRPFLWDHRGCEMASPRPFQLGSPLSQGGASPAGCENIDLFFRLWPQSLVHRRMRRKLFESTNDGSIQVGDVSTAMHAISYGRVLSLPDFHDCAKLAWTLGWRILLSRS
jgi:hypothetical protein